MESGEDDQVKENCCNRKKVKIQKSVTSDHETEVTLSSFLINPEAVQVLCRAAQDSYIRGIL